MPKGLVIRLILVLQLILPCHFAISDDPMPAPPSLNEFSNIEIVEFFQYLNLLCVKAHAFLIEQIRTQGMEGEWNSDRSIEAYREMAGLLFVSWIKAMELPTLSSDPEEEAQSALPSLEQDPFLRRIQAEVSYEVDRRRWEIPSTEEILEVFHSSPLRLPSRAFMTEGKKIKLLEQFLERSYELHEIYAATHSAEDSPPPLAIPIPNRYRIYFDEIMGSNLVRLTQNEQTFSLSMRDLSRIHLAQRAETFHPTFASYLRVVKFLLLYQFITRGVALQRYKDSTSSFEYSLPEGGFALLNGVAPEIALEIDKPLRELSFRSRLADVIRQDSLADLPIFLDHELIADILEYLPALNEPRRVDRIYQSYVLSDGQSPEEEEQSYLKNQIAGQAHSTNDEQEPSVGTLLSSFKKTPISEMNTVDLTNFLMRLFIHHQRYGAYQQCRYLIENSPSSTTSEERRQIHLLLRLREEAMMENPAVIEQYRQIATRWQREVAEHLSQSPSPRAQLLELLKTESQKLVALDNNIEKLNAGIDIDVTIPAQEIPHYLTIRGAENMAQGGSVWSQSMSRNLMSFAGGGWQQGRREALQRIGRIDRLLESGPDRAEELLLRQEQDELIAWIGSMPEVAENEELPLPSLNFKLAYLNRLRQSLLMRYRILAARIPSPISYSAKELYKVMEEIEGSETSNKSDLFLASLDQGLASYEENIRETMTHLIEAENLEDLRPFILTGMASSALTEFNPEWSVVQSLVTAELQPGMMTQLAENYIPTLLWSEIALLLLLGGATLLFPVITPATAIPMKILSAAIFVEAIVLDGYNLYKFAPESSPIGGTQGRLVTHIDQIIHSTVLGGAHDDPSQLDMHVALQQELAMNQAMLLFIAVPIQFFYYRSLFRRTARAIVHSQYYPLRLRQARQYFNLSEEYTLSDIDQVVREKLRQNPQSAVETQSMAELLRETRARAIFQLERNFTLDALARTFRRRAQELHPDLHPGQGSIPFQELGQARDYLETIGRYETTCRILGLAPHYPWTPQTLDRVFHRLTHPVTPSRMSQVILALSESEREALLRRSFLEAPFLRVGYRLFPLIPDNVMYERFIEAVREGAPRSITFWLQHGDRLILRNSIEQLLRENYNLLLPEARKNFIATTIAQWGPLIYGSFGFRRKMAEIAAELRASQGDSAVAALTMEVRLQERLLSQMIHTLELENDRLSLRSILQLDLHGGSEALHELYTARNYLRQAGELQVPERPLLGGGNP